MQMRFMSQYGCQWWTGKSDFGGTSSSMQEKKCMFASNIVDFSYKIIFRAFVCFSIHIQNDIISALFGYLIINLELVRLFFSC